jgi:hypothetical protein
LTEQFDRTEKKEKGKRHPDKKTVSLTLQPVARSGSVAVF